MNTTFHAKDLNHSISPIDIKSEEDKDKEIEDHEIEEERVEAEEEKHESEVVRPPVDESGEMRRPRLGRRPMLPTKAEVLEHYPLHLNYRSW